MEKLGGCSCARRLRDAERIAARATATKRRQRARGWTARPGLESGLRVAFDGRQRFRPRVQRIRRATAPALVRVATAAPAQVRPRSERVVKRSRTADYARLTTMRLMLHALRDAAMGPWQAYTSGLPGRTGARDLRIETRTVLTALKRRLRSSRQSPPKNKLRLQNRFTASSSRLHEFGRHRAAVTQRPEAIS